MKQQHTIMLCPKFRLSTWCSIHSTNAQESTHIRTLLQYQYGDLDEAAYPLSLSTASAGEGGASAMGGAGGLGRDLEVGQGGPKTGSGKRGASNTASHPWLQSSASMPEAAAAAAAGNGKGGFQAVESATCRGDHGGVSSALQMSSIPSSTRPLQRYGSLPSGPPSSNLLYNPTGKPSCHDSLTSQRPTRHNSIASTAQQSSQAFHPPYPPHLYGTTSLDQGSRQGSLVTPATTTTPTAVAAAATPASQSTLHGRHTTNSSHSSQPLQQQSGTTSRHTSRHSSLMSFFCGGGSGSAVPRQASRFELDTRKPCRLRNHTKLMSKAQESERKKINNIIC